MLKPRYLRYIPGMSGFLPFAMEDNDKVLKTSPTAKALYMDKNMNESGKDRLYMMFTIDEFAKISPELNAVYQAGFLGTLFGICYGGFIQSRLAYMDFMEKNQATAFKDHIDAKKKLQDQVTRNFVKGGFKWGWRLGLFSSSYVLITTTISVYRGKSSFVEYLAAGFLTGAMYKANMGIRGVIVGGGLGCVLGGFAGGVSLLILKATGMTMEEARYWQYKWRESRDKQMQKAFQEYGETKDEPLITQHNIKVGEAGKSLENLKSDS